MKSELDAEKLSAFRNELQDLLEGAYAYESSLSLINVALGGDPPDEEEES